MNALLGLASIIMFCALITLCARFWIVRRDVRRRQLRFMRDPNTGEVLDDVILRLRRCRDPTMRDNIIHDAINKLFE